MRRPRSKLQVSTFPFLAVLLCAMGSLLLLLFIMDRRAKIAARNNALEKLQACKARTQEEEAVRQAEWDKAKQQLHLSLLQQYEQLGAASKGFHQDLNDTGKNLVIVQTRHLELDQQLKGEAAKIEEIQSQIASRRVSLQDAEKKETMSKAELADAVKELAELEKTVLLLRALKDREKEVYSVVPYRGKRGDSRPPIYVECVRAGVLFHPEKKLLRGFDFNPDSVRSEVERRFGPLAVQKLTKDKNKPAAEEPKGPYVLFLVRPDGIENYYKAQAALRGYQLDFGYELVDEHWALDFSGAAYAKNPVPSNTAQVPYPTSTLTPPLPLLTGTGPGNGGASLGQGPGGPFRGEGGAPPDRLGPVPLTTNPGIGSGGTGGFGGGSGSPVPSPLTGNAVAGSMGPPGFGGGGSVLPAPSQPGNAVAGSSVPPGFGDGSALPAPPLPGNAVAGSSAPAALAVGTGSGAPASPGGAGNATYPGAPGNGLGKGPAFVPMAKSLAPGSLPSAGNPNQTGNANGGGASASPEMIASAGPANSPQGSGLPNNLNPINTPGPGSNAATQRTGGGSISPNGAGVPSDGGSPEAGPRPLPTFGVDPGKKPAGTAPPLSKMLGNKDFVITIDCHGDHANVSPGSTIHRWTASNLSATDQALVQTVTNLIARRQASVRPGEPPYRPLIRFQVSAEGLRCYLHVYPLLEHLRVPMTRENVAE